MKQIRIAVSGAPGSFSEEAALLYAQHNGIINPKLIFAIDMEGALTALDKRRTEKAIFPVVNGRGGLVQAAFKAMGKHKFTYIDELNLEVHQCLMALPGTTKKQIKKIASHAQALVQCDKYIKKNYSNAQMIEWQDTAKAAQDLKNGKLTKDTAVIAPARCAEIYGLKLVEKSIQDTHPNITTFIIVTK